MAPCWLPHALSTHFRSLTADYVGRRLAWPAAVQVLENSLEARVLQSDNSALACDCRKEMKALNARLLKLGG